MRAFLQPNQLLANPNQSVLFQKALQSLFFRQQLLLYVIIARFTIMLVSLIQNQFYCQFAQPDSWALIYLIVQLYQMVHCKNMKVYLSSYDKMNEISMILQVGYNEPQLSHPTRKNVEEMIGKLNNEINRQDVSLQREQRYIMFVSQVLVIKFILIMDSFPTTSHLIINHFGGGCNDILLNNCYYLFLLILLENLVLYLMAIAILLAVPVLIIIYSYRKIKKTYILYQIRKSIFVTHQHQGLDDEWAQNEKECSICMQEYIVGDSLMRLPCNTAHLFHETCIRQWLQVSTECPLCRKQLVDPSLNIQL